MQAFLKHHNGNKKKNDAFLPVYFFFIKDAKNEFNKMKTNSNNE